MCDPKQEPEFDIAIAIAQEAAVIAGECAAALASARELPMHRSENVQAALHRIAAHCRNSGGQIAETVFLSLAQQIEDVSD